MSTFVEGILWTRKFTQQYKALYSLKKQWATFRRILLLYLLAINIHRRNVSFCCYALSRVSYFSLIFTVPDENKKHATTFVSGNRNTKKLGETFGNKRRLFQDTRNINEKVLIVASVNTRL